MKKWICLLLVLMTSLGVSAKSVVFTMNDGTEVYYLLSTGVNPILRFKEGRMVVNEDAYEFSDIKNFYISETNDPNAIDFLLSGKDVPMAANTVIIPADAVEDVKVYMVDGKEVKTNTAKYEEWEYDFDTETTEPTKPQVVIEEEKKDKSGLYILLGVSGAAFLVSLSTMIFLIKQILRRKRL